MNEQPKTSQTKMDLESYVRYTKRDFSYLEGVADTLAHSGLRNRIVAMRRNLNCLGNGAKGQAADDA